MEKVILITGATSGIGLHVAERYLEQGDSVIIVSNAGIEETKNDLAKYGDKACFIYADLGKKEDIENIFIEVGKKFSHIDILINNAAFDINGYIENYNYDDYKKIIDVNLIGKVFCIQGALPFLKKSKYPNIINIASRLAIKPRIDGSAYSSAAAGIVMLTKSAAVEFEKYGIRVNCVSPSVTLTPLALQSFTHQEIDEFAKKSTRGRICTKEDIYQAIEFLCSPNSDFINGENINLNGGMLLKW